METIYPESVDELEKTLESMKKEEKRLREVWRKLAIELRSFKVDCPHCGGEMRITGLRNKNVMEGSVADPGKTRIAKRTLLMFQCFECGHISDFDLDFFSSKHLEKSKE